MQSTTNINIRKFCFIILLSALWLGLVYCCFFYTLFEVNSQTLPLPEIEDLTLGLKVTYHEVTAAIVGSPPVSWYDTSTAVQRNLLGVYRDDNIDFANLFNTLNSRDINEHHIAAKWDGMIYLPVSGLYKFTVIENSDECTNLEIGGSYVLYGCGEQSSNRTFDKGWHTFRAYWINNIGNGSTNAKMQLKWDPPGPYSEEIIPEEYFLASDWSDANITIPHEGEAGKINYLAAGVSMSSASEPNYKVNLTSNKLKFDLPGCPPTQLDCILEDDIWVIWSNEQYKTPSVKINGVTIQTESAHINGTDIFSSIGYQRLTSEQATDLGLTEAGGKAELNVSGMDAQGAQVKKSFTIDANNNGLDVKIDKFLITSDLNYEPGLTDDTAPETNINNINPGPKIYKEAENCPPVYSDNIGTDSSASNGQYWDPRYSDSNILCSFYISNSAKYNVWGRVKSTSATKTRIVDVRWNSRMPYREWSYINTNNTWRWIKIGVDNFQNVQLYKNDHLNWGLSIIVPYYTDDPATPSQKLNLKLMNSGVYGGASRPLIVRFPEITDQDILAGANKIKPTFLFMDGETRKIYAATKQASSVRPNYLYWAHGKDSDFPDSNFWNFTDQGNGAGQLLSGDGDDQDSLMVPKDEKFFTDPYNPDYWLPAFGREGHHFDVLSSNYAQNQASDESGNGTLPDLSLDAGDTWLAFQVLSMNPYNLTGVGGGESMSWIGGLTNLGYSHPKAPVVTCISSTSNKVKFEWEGFSDPNYGDKQYAFDIQIVEYDTVAGTCGNYDNPTELKKIIYERSEDYYYEMTEDLEVGNYCWRVRVYDDSPHNLVSDWNECTNMQVTGNKPTADAGSKITKTVGVSGFQLNDPVSLDGSKSSDLEDCPDGDESGSSLIYEWTLISKPVGSTASISDENSCFTKLQADSPGVYLINLTVTDSDGNSDELDTPLICEIEIPDICGDNVFNFIEEVCDASASDGDAACPGMCFNCRCFNWKWWEIFPFF